MAELRADVAGLKADGETLKKTMAGLRVDMADQKADLYRLVMISSVATVTFTAGLTVGLLKLLP